MGFSRYYRLSVRLYAGFTEFNIQRASAGASSYCVTKQTGLSKCSSQPLGKDEKLPRGRDTITLLVVHLFYVSGSVYRFEVSYFDCNL